MTPAWEGQLGVQGSARVPSLFWLTLGLGGLLYVVALAARWSEASTVLYGLALLLPVGWVARKAASPIDGRWLPTVIIVGYLVKLATSGLRFWVLEVLYNGIGDATGYHGHGITLAPLWRTLSVPLIRNGTEFVQATTGLLYVPYTPTKLGGFLLFATLAFFGQVLLYLAFRNAFPSGRLKWYAALIFFFPNVLFWPSSIGKESLMLLFIGLCAYGSSKLFTTQRLRWIWLVGLGMALSAAIRSHIALLMAVSLLVVVVVGRFASLDHPLRRRGALLVMAGAVGLGVGMYAADDFGIDLTALNEALLEEEIEPIFAGVERQTSRGGSAVEGSSVMSLKDAPATMVRVIFSPLPHEAHNTQALAASLADGTLLLALFLWRAPAIIRNFLRKWRSPYLLFSMLYMVGFVIGHSAILNFGIIARQRSQLMPFLFVLLVELGAPPAKKPVEAPPQSFEPVNPVLLTPSGLQ